MHMTSLEMLWAAPAAHNLVTPVTPKLDFTHTVNGTTHMYAVSGKSSKLSRFHLVIYYSHLF